MMEGGLTVSDGDIKYLVPSAKYFSIFVCSDRPGGRTDERQSPVSEK